MSSAADWDAVAGLAPPPLAPGLGGVPETAPPGSPGGPAMGLNGPAAPNVPASPLAPPGGSPGAPGAAGGAPDRWAGIVDAIDGGNTRAAQGALFAAGDVKPDDAGRALALAKASGVPAPLVADDVKGFEQQVEQAQNAAIVRSNPVLAGWLAAEPMAAPIAKDDLANLDFVSRLAAGFSAGLGHASANARAARLAYDDLGRGIDPALDWRLQQLDAAAKPPASFGTAGDVAEWVGRNVVGPFAEVSAKAAPYAAGGAAVGGTLGAVGGPLAPATVPAGVVAGGAAGFTAGAAADFFKQGTGELYRVLSGVRDAQGQPLDPHTILGASLLGGLAQAGLATFGLKVAAGPAEAAISSLVSDGVRQAVTRPTFATAARSLGLGLAKSAAEGAGFGVASEGINLAAEQAARILGGDDTASILNDPAQRAEAVSRLAEAAENMAGVMLAFHGAPRVGEFAGDLARARQSADDISLFANLEAGAADSKVRARSAELFQGFLARQLDGGGAENIFVPGSKVDALYQAYRIDPSGGEDPLFGFVPDMQSQLAEARATGGDVVIPTADYVAHLAGTEVSKALLPDLRVRQDGMSLNEATEFERNRATLAAEAGKRFGDDQAASAAAAAPVQAVYDDMFSKLRAAGFTNDTAAQNAALVASRYATRAARLADGASGPMTLETLPQALLERAGEGEPLPEGNLHPAERSMLGEAGLTPAVDAKGQAAYDAAPLRAEAARRRSAGLWDASAAAGDTSHIEGFKPYQAPRTALDLYRSEGLEVRRELPPSLKSPDVEPNLDGLLNELRKGVKLPSDRALFGPSLIDFLVKRGGVIDTGGELRAMDAGKARKGLVREAPEDRGAALFGGGDTFGARENDKRPDASAHAAWEAGYFPENAERPEPDDLFEAIRDELAGKPRYAEANIDHPAADRVAVLRDLEHHLGALGIDLETMNNAEVRKALADPSHGADADVFDQARPIALRGDELGSADRPFSERRDAGRALFDKLKAAGPVDNPALGRIQFSGKSKGRTFHAIDDLSLAMLPALRDILAQGKLAGTSDSAKADANVKAYHRLEAPVTIDGKPYVAGVVIREDNNGRFYYDLAGRNAEGGSGLATMKGAAEQGGSPELANPPSRETLNQSMGAKPDAINLDARPADRSSGPNGARDDAGEPNGVRGSITLENGRAIVRVFRDADLSTFAHEMGHQWLAELVRDASDPAAPEGVKADLATILEWFGVADPAAIERAHHEQFARGVEQYLMEGRAPSPALGSVFAKFAAWLKSIYRTVAALGVPMSDDIRAVMDRLLATDAEIDAARRAERLNPLFPDAKSAGMTKAEYRAYTDGVKRAGDAAQSALLSKVMAAVRKARTAEWKAERAGLRDEVESEYRSRPDFRAETYLRTGRLLDPAEGAALEPQKLDRQAIVDLYGSEGVLDELPRGIYVHSGGVGPDEVAPLFGYHSGDAMLRDLMALEDTRRQARAATGKPRLDLLQHLVDQETDRRMFERHGDPLSDGSIEAEALAAVHSDA